MTEIPARFESGDPSGWSEWEWRYETVDSFESHGFVVALLKRTDIGWHDDGRGLDDGVFGHVAVFESVEGIGNRRMWDWGRAWITTRASGIEYERRQFDQLRNEARWRRRHPSQMDWEEDSYGREAIISFVNDMCAEVEMHPEPLTEDLRAVESNLLGPNFLKCPECDIFVVNAYADEGIGNRRVWTFGYQQGRFEGIAIGCTGCGRIFSAVRPFDEIDRTVVESEEPENTTDGDEIEFDHNGWWCPCGTCDRWEPVARTQGIGNRDVGWQHDGQVLAYEAGDHMACMKCGRVYQWSADRLAQRKGPRSSWIGMGTQFVERVDPKMIT